MPAQRIEHHSTTDCSDAGFIANHESISAQRHHWFIQHQLGQPILLRSNLPGFVEYNSAAKRFGCSSKEAQALIAFECPFGGRTNFDGHVDPRGSDIKSFVREYVTALQ